MKPEIDLFVDEYLGELIQGSAAVFVGAGLSIPAGYVDWRELVRPLANELNLDVTLETDFIALAQFHVNANGSNRHKLHKAIIEKLSPDLPPTRNHQLLARLPIRTWWTTNYDKMIETVGSAALQKAEALLRAHGGVAVSALDRRGFDVLLEKAETTLFAEGKPQLAEALHDVNATNDSRVEPLES